MSSFSTYDGGSGEGSWWEIQHSWGDGRGWADTDLSQFGKAALDVLRSARDAKLFDGFYHHFRSEKDATTYLIEFARAAVCHKSMSFRVVKVHASITVEEVLEVTPPKVCGQFGYYADQLGLSRDSRATEALYCQQPPGHRGEHGPKKKARVAT